jgi:hypothetical protein
MDEPNSHEMWEKESITVQGRENSPQWNLHSKGSRIDMDFSRV